MLIPKMVAYIESLGQPPSESSSYDSWIECRDIVDFLIKSVSGDVPVSYSGRHLFLYSVLVPLDRLEGDLQSELAQWNHLRLDGWTSSIQESNNGALIGSLNCPMYFTGSETLNDCDPLVFQRYAEGRKPNRYIEPLQQFLQVADAHWNPDRQTFTRFNSHGDIVDVVQSKYVAGEPLCFVGAEELDRYLFASGQALVRLFDAGRSEHLDRTPFVTEEKQLDINESDLWAELELEIGPERIERGNLRGFQLLSSLPVRGQWQMNFRTEHHQKESFLIWDAKHGVVRDFPGKRVTPEETPIEDDWPEMISPAFFRPEVLSKYKADPDKYQLSQTTIECRGSWFLRSYDLNEAGQVHAYLKDLWNLPISEQKYWRSFNEQPLDHISERAYSQDFGRMIWNGDDPLRELCDVLLSFPSATIADHQVELWTLGNQDLRKLHYVATESRTEWQNQIRELAMIVVEGFSEKSLRKIAVSMGGNPQELKSLKLIELCLTTAKVDSNLIGAICNPLQILNNFRNTSGAAHRAASKTSVGPTAYFPLQHRELLKDIAESMTLLAEHIQAGLFDMPSSRRELRNSLAMDSTSQ